MYNADVKALVKRMREVAENASGPEMDVFVNSGQLLRVLDELEVLDLEARGVAHGFIKQVLR